jgi:hypothetical protein
VHKTNSGEKRKTLKDEARVLASSARALQKAACIPAALQEARRLQDEANTALAEAENLKLLARLEDLNVWQMTKAKTGKKGTQTYTYWMASWREGGRTRNVHMGSARKIDAEAARQKARKMKAEAIHAN